MREDSVSREQFNAELSHAVQYRKTWLQINTALPICHASQHYRPFTMHV